jgi:hypothetical protein
MVTGKNQNYFKEFPLDSMKVSGVINMKCKTDFNVKFANDGDTGTHHWFAGGGDCC